MLSDVVIKYFKLSIYILTVISFNFVFSNQLELDPDDIQNYLENIYSRAYEEPLLKRDTDKNADINSWHGKWFPSRPIISKNIENLNKQNGPSDSDNSMWNMINSFCDDGKTNLTTDWDDSFVNYTCLTQLEKIKPDPDTSALLEHYPIPMAYSAPHVCMNSTIDYPYELPTFGAHRPAWAVYGEYIFLPRTRWIHNLEHGAVVMLYDPCANSFVVNKLREIVKSCLYRYVITPYNFLRKERPIALVTWGWALKMSDVNMETAINFIKEHALKGPEKISRDGFYDHMLIEKANYVTDKDDSVLCPNN